MHRKVSIAIRLYRISRWFYVHHLKLFAHLFYRMLYISFNCVIPYTANLEKGVEIAHAVGIVIHDKAIIKKGTKIYQHVTIGGGPIVIGENCLIGSGAVVMANLGDNVKVGANAVVTKEGFENCTIVGVPAKIIK